MFFLTTGQASEMLSRTGFLSEGESLFEQTSAAPGARVSFAEHHTPQVVAAALAEAMRDSTFVIAIVTSTGMHPDAEDLNLYYAFRRSFQDHRSLLEAPAHMFEAEDFYHLRSFLFMAAAFRWDALVFTSEEPTPFEIGRDHSLRFQHEQSAVAKKFASSLTGSPGSARMH
ncbi:MAG: hypothetical protein AAF909_02190 [Pseudomonadota bacterium]